MSDLDLAVEARHPTLMWEPVCTLDDLVPERGAAAMVAGVQVALYRAHDGTVYAVQQHDPHSGANVMSRGLLGSLGEVPIVVSPMYKQVYDLRTGACLDSIGMEPVALRTWPVRVVDGEVLVGVEARPWGAT